MIDSHAHLQLAPPTAPGTVGTRLARHAQGLDGLVAVGVHPDEWPLQTAFVEEFRADPGAPRLWRGVGLHPQWVELGRWREDLERLRATACKADVIGECGLHFSADTSQGARSAQLEVFAAAIELARATQRPLSIHGVGAAGALAEQLMQRRAPPSFLHAYAGSPELARQLTRRGHLLGLGPRLLDPRARRLRALATELPLDALVVETDADYCAGTGAGRREQAPPAREALGQLVTELAALRGAPIEAVQAALTDNTRRLLQTPAA